MHATPTPFSFLSHALSIGGSVAPRVAGRVAAVERIYLHGEAKEANPYSRNHDEGPSIAVIYHEFAYLRGQFPAPGISRLRI